MNTKKRKQAEIDAKQDDVFIQFSQELDEYYRSRSSTGENLKREDMGWREYGEWVAELFRKDQARRNGEE